MGRRAYSRVTALEEQLDAIAARASQVAAEEAVCAAADAAAEVDRLRPKARAPWDSKEGAFRRAAPLLFALSDGPSAAPSAAEEAAAIDFGGPRPPDSLAQAAGVAGPLGSAAAWTLAPSLPGGASKGAAPGSFTGSLGPGKLAHAETRGAAMGATRLGATAVAVGATAWLLLGG